MDATASNEVFLRRVTDGVVRVALLAAWTAWCFTIVVPFLVPLVWGGILATAVAPVSAKLGGQRPKLAAAGITVLALAALLVPSWLFVDSITEGLVDLGHKLAAGELEVPPPPDYVAEWPVVGERIHEKWSSAMNEPHAAVRTLTPQLQDVGNWLVKSMGGLGLGLAQTVFAIIIAGVLMANATGSRRALGRVAMRLAPGRGEELVSLAAATIRSVAVGVLGVAAIQATLAAAGMLVAGVPGAGVWSLLVLIVAVMQLPPALILGPVAAYVFHVSSTPMAVGFLIWTILVSVSDSVLKPLLLGRGVGVPTLVILVGAIGGMMTQGIIGLFVGAVVLGVGYQIFVAWVQDPDEPSLEAPAPE